MQKKAVQSVGRESEAAIRVFLQNRKGPKYQRGQKGHKEKKKQMGTRFRRQQQCITGGGFLT